MMPVIRISDPTWERLKKHARPFEDTPEDIVRKALDALEGVTTPSKAASLNARTQKAKRGDKLPQKEFRDPLLKVLLALGGGADVSEIREQMLKVMQARLSNGDFAMVSSGEPRWWNAICWERNDLRKEGFIENDSVRGRWELTQAGRVAASLLG